MINRSLIKVFLINLIFLFLFNNLNAETVSEDKSISDSTETNQQNIDTNGVTLTITNSTVSRNNKPILVDATLEDVSISIDSDSTVESTDGDNPILGKNTTRLTVNNSGTISSSAQKSIDIYQSTDAEITNNSGAVISAAKHAIRTGGISADPTTGYTITNSGKIYATDTTKGAIFSNTYSTGGTITNNSGGEIYSNGSQATIRVGATTTITNSGSIKNNNDLDNSAIQLLGNSNTVTLKNDGIVVGKITADSGTTGNTLKFQHGFGQGYFYNTSGDFTLEDLDGNQVVQGSAGSVGQGGSETLDELLGYKSLNIRKSLNRYKKSKSFIEGKDSWGEAYVSNLKRKENNNNLAIGYDHKTFGINLINPLQSSHFMLSLEHSKQDLLQDHSITRYGLLTGLYFPQLKNLGKFETENFVSAGITLNDSERTILTNTTTSGILNVTDTYETYEVIAGKKFKYFDNLSNINLIPDIGITVGYSLTPSHSESKYFIWDKKHVANLTASLSDEYSIQISGNTNLSVGWIGDFRRLITEQKQKYEINGTKATFSPGNELKNEITFAGNIGLKHDFLKYGLISFNLEGSHSTQNTNSITGYVAMKFKF